MNEQNDTPAQESAGRKQDAIDVNDFVFAATGARVRRLTTPEGEHWFPAADVAMNLGYANTRQALLWHVAPDCTMRLSELAAGVYALDALSKLAGHKLQKSMRMVNLRGLVQLVNGCTKPECEPFKAWVCEVIETVQRDGSYSLEPAPVQPATPTGGIAYLMPQQVADVIVRLEERNIRADEALAIARLEETELLRRANEERSRANEERRRANEERTRANEERRRANDVLHRIADTLDLLVDRFRPTDPAVEPPAITPQQLLAAWRAKNLVVTDDVHAVAACLAPALVRGPARCRLDEVAARTGLTLDRVNDCLRMLLKRGCMRQTGCDGDGVPVYVLP
ncbi:prophage antirepressor-like protein [Streptomyces sp. Ag109_O5-1]|uniref:BRO-N domain-containing protein n=1 Tax=Streptomyces sp. Ag109_O5-1 TaxID=1938851 RepID=UPI000F4EE197|nr:Bro-N domain-containing protein [Streptomyces sp. Ag109_O5-1]RPE42564.1 prophage antirepressor-like protein [Streptomyces sp. Ag109_O5-1]